MDGEAMSFTCDRQNSIKYRLEAGACVVEWEDRTKNMYELRVEHAWCSNDGTDLFITVEESTQGSRLTNESIFPVLTLRSMIIEISIWCDD